jgi:hypothetical protein
MLHSGGYAAKCQVVWAPATSEVPYRWEQDPRAAISNDVDPASCLASFQVLLAGICSRSHSHGHLQIYDIVYSPRRLRPVPPRRLSSVHSASLRPSRCISRTLNLCFADIRKTLSGSLARTLRAVKVAELTRVSRRRCLNQEI